MKVSLKIPFSMQKEEYSGSIWKPYSHIILNMCSTHQSYGLTIDLKLYNAYLGKLPTQFSISNSTLTQLLCRRAGAVSTPADILHWGRLQGLTSSLLQDGVKEQMRPKAGQQILASPGPWALQPAVGQHSCCPLSFLLSHSRAQTDDRISSVQDSRLSFPHTWSHILPTLLRAQSRAAHSNSICAFEPRPVITATDSSSSPGGLWSVSRFQWCTVHARYANLAGPCHFEAGFSQEHSKAAPGAAEFQSTYLHCWNSLL